MTLEAVAPTEHFTRAVVECSQGNAMVTQEAIYNRDGVKVLDKGVTITANLYDRLMSHALRQPIESSLTAASQVDGMALRDGVEGVIAEEPFYARMVPDLSHRERMLDAIEAIPLAQPLAFQLTIARDRYPDLYHHLLCATWVMSWLSFDRLGVKFDLSQAAAAGLMHDLGMIHLDPRLMDPSVALDQRLRQQLYSHPLVTRLLLERHHGYSQEVINAVLEHHEALDGSGYPRHLSGAAIGAMGRKLAITEVITAFMGDRPDSGELRLGVLLRMNLHRYDRDLIRQVMTLLNPSMDPRTDLVPIIDQPGETLIRIVELARAWPLADASVLNAHDPHRPAMMRVTAQVNQLKQTLAEAGLIPEQIKQMGNISDDVLLLRELSLLALEANWQLAAVGQTARRLWTGGKDVPLPASLAKWVDEVHALTEPLLARNRGWSDADDWSADSAIQTAS